jgi:DNA-binding transcriptional MocR family regulator
LRGILAVRPVESGMYLTAWLPSDWSDRDTAAALAREGVVAAPLSALTLATPRPPGLVLGYAGHSEVAMARAVERMAAIFEQSTGMVDFAKLELIDDQSRP